MSGVRHFRSPFPLPLSPPPFPSLQTQLPPLKPTTTSNQIKAKNKNKSKRKEEKKKDKRRGINTDVEGNNRRIQNPTLPLPTAQRKRLRHARQPRRPRRQELRARRRVPRQARREGLEQGRCEEEGEQGWCGGEVRFPLLTLGSWGWGGSVRWRLFLFLF